MELDKFNRQLMARYLANNCTEQEQHDIEQWIESNPEDKQKLRELERIWEVSEGDRPFKKSMFEANQSWKDVQSRLQKEGELNGEASGLKSQPSSIHSVTQKVVRVAAIFLLAGFVGFLTYQNWYQPEPEKKEIALREISTANGQRANLTLGDGTQVMLNAGSNMKFPKQFEADVREVYLKGEAYFDVKTNVDRPFVIYSRGSVIRVLGTSFSVRSYPEDEHVRVVVKEGRVSFKPQKSDDDSRTLLTAKELGRYDRKSKEITTTQINDLQLYLSWREGYLKFREEPMSQVAEALERRYGVTVSFQDGQIKEKKLTAFLKSRSIRNVLDVIAMSLEVEYRLEDNDVTFLNK